MNVSPLDSLYSFIFKFLGIRHEFSDRVDTNTSIRNVTVQVFPITSESINSTNRHTFSGLFGGETYDCGLGAINFAGPGELSNRITFTTPADGGFSLV